MRQRQLTRRTLATALAALVIATTVPAGFPGTAAASPESAPTASAPPTPTTSPLPITTPCAGCAVARRSTFERGKPQGWSAYGGASASVVAEAAGAGRYGLLVRGVTDRAGAGLTVRTAALKPKRSLVYELSVMARLAPGQGRFALDLRVEGARSGYSRMTQVGDDGWTQLAVRFTPGTTTSRTITVRLERSILACGTAPALDVHLDEARLTVLPEGSPLNPPPLAADPACTVTAWGARPH